MKVDREEDTGLLMFLSQIQQSREYVGIVCNKVVRRMLNNCGFNRWIWAMSRYEIWAILLSISIAVVFTALPIEPTRTWKLPEALQYPKHQLRWQLYHKTISWNSPCFPKYSITISQRCVHTHIHAHTHIYIYIYIYI